MLPGLNTVAAKRAGRVLLYVYAWKGRGAPMIGRYEGATREEAEAAKDADAAGLAGRYSEYVGKSEPDARFMSGLISMFKARVETREIELAESTKALWYRYMDEIADTFGETSLRALQAKGARAVIRDWYIGLGKTPGKAEVCLSIMSRLFTFAVDLELMDRNPVVGMKRAFSSPSRAGMTWTREQLEAVMTDCNEEQTRALELAWTSGLRRSDLATLLWSHIDFEAGVIIKPTIKGRRYGRKCHIPLSDDLRAALAKFPRVSTHVVTNSFGRPYKHGESFGKSLEKRIRAAGVKLTLHDIRGTYVTREVFGRGSSDEDAEYIMGWAPGQGKKMRAIYGDPDALGRAAAKRWMQKAANQ